MSGTDQLHAKLKRLLAGDPSHLPSAVTVAEPALFEQTVFGMDTQAEGVTAFAAYARLAASGRLSPALAVALDGDRDALLHWYVTQYAPAMRPHRVPLSAADIAYLLASDPLSAAETAQPRIVLWDTLLRRGQDAALPGIDDPAIAYAWACERAPALGIEDCLVPETFVACLSAAVDGGTVLERLIGERDRDLAALHAGDAPRAVLDGFLAVLAIEQPGLIRFFTPARIEPAFFDPIIASVGVTEPGAAKGLADRLSAACAAAGFDTVTRRYVSRSEHGHRGLAVIAPGAPAIGRVKADIEIVGPLSLHSGLGQAARRSVETFLGAGVKVKVTDFVHGFPSPAEPYRPTGATTAGEAAATLFHLNPDMLPRAFAFGPGGYAARRAGFFFWELDAPATCDFLALDLVQAIWTATAFVRGIFAPHFSGTTACVGLAMPVITPPDRVAARAALRQRLALSHDDFVAVSVFDGLSYAARKNPDGAIRAFQAAFPDRQDVALILKAHNRPSLLGAGSQGAIWRAVEDAVATDNRIRLVDGTMAHEEVLAMIAGADLFLSLHRSEGFGLGPAEAMQVGTPVVVTAYGGTEDFCSDATAFRVPFALAPVARDAYVHAEPGRVWAEPDLTAAAGSIRTAAENPALARARAAAAMAQIEEAHGFAAITRRYIAALERLLLSS